MRVYMAGLSPEGLTYCDSHRHDRWEIVVCLRGSGILTVGEREIALHEGIIVCQPPNVPHEERDLADYQDLWLQVDEFDLSAGEEAAVCEDDGERRFSVLSRMTYEFFCQKEEGAVASALTDALYALLAGRLATRRDPRVAAFCREIVMNLSNASFDLTACMERSGYCADHFRRLFKKEMGETPLGYLTGLRLARAKRLLERRQSGGLTVRQIAKLCGFDDPYYFSTLFRRSVGCSPSGYRGDP